MKAMVARYNGRCAGCNGSIRRGEPIGYDRPSRSAWHPECAGTDPDKRSYAVTFSSGETFYRNVKGRCEDAPCCGCCTI